MLSMVRLGAAELGERFFEEVPVLPFDRSAAESYARLPFKGAEYDRLIAAHALSRNLVLVTNGTAGFAWAEGLATENWAIAD